MRNGIRVSNRGRKLLAQSTIAIVLGLGFLVVYLSTKWESDKSACLTWYRAIQVGTPLDKATELLRSKGSRVVPMEGGLVKAYPSGLPACYVYVEAISNAVTHVSVRSSDRFDRVWAQK